MSGAVFGSIKPSQQGFSVRVMFICDYCGHETLDQHDMTEHMKVHENDSLSSYEQKNKYEQKNIDPSIHEALPYDGMAYAHAENVTKHRVPVLCVKCGSELSDAKFNSLDSVEQQLCNTCYSGYRHSKLQCGKEFTSVALLNERTAVEQANHHHEYGKRCHEVSIQDGIDDRIQSADTENSNLDSQSRDSNSPTSVSIMSSTDSGNKSLVSDDCSTGIAAAKLKKFAGSVHGRFLAREVDLDHTHDNSNSSVVEPDKLLTCSYCGRQFARKWNVHRHQLSCSAAKSQHAENDDVHNNLNSHILNRNVSVNTSDTLSTNNGSESPVSDICNESTSATKSRHFSCSMCGKRFAWKKSLVRHTITCSDSSEDRDSYKISLKQSKAGYSCSTCGQHFAQKLNLHQHVLSCNDYSDSGTVHNDSMILSMTVESENDNTDDINNFDNQSSGSNSCGSFDTTNALSTNYGSVVLVSDACNKAEATGKQFSCSVCGKRLAHKRNIARHLRDCHGILNFGTVNDGSAVLSVAAAESRHIEGNNNRQSNEPNCETKDDQFQSEYLDKTTAVDVRKTRRDRQTVCNNCGEEFFWTSSLRKHLQSNCNDATQKNGNHKCSKCGRSFALSKQLITHLAAHKRHTVGPDVTNLGTTKEFLCCYCGRLYGSATELRVHLLRHIGAKPHQCKICGKAFIVATLLNEHIAVKHEGQRLVCEQCGHKANSRGALHNHIRVAHAPPGSVQPFVCTICKRRFWSAAALRHHESAHADSRNGKRKAMCGICHLLYRHVYNLGHHIATVHQEVSRHPTPFECATCGDQFESGERFKAHYRSKHRNR